MWPCRKGTLIVETNLDSCSVWSLLGWIHLVASVVSFLFFTDMLIYWIHRGLHHRLVYKVESFKGQRRGKISHILVL